MGRKYRPADPGLFNRPPGHKETVKNTAQGPQGTIYLLHFDRPLGHARHYTGWTRDLVRRLARHGRGQGARLLQVAHERGIKWTLAATWAGTRADERKKKDSGSARRYCPICLSEK
jgi:predicted GIY-YIG superfamily endonuclease